ncbi:cupin domain-containing protein [Paenibacillus elgii]|uniref:Cupin domain-containing protein n=1 Tax=Paenibacillus elgii TaxID=189691 RepID=A0A2T6G5Y9_9BACL|nr:cupin domain-containing protein [Paenibacillus elgii]PUA39570.1 cupin domain-containing protein [Paenibacillus elgii]
MKRYCLSELQDAREGHILNQVLSGDYVSSGGLAFSKPGERSHTNDGPGGRDYHVHTDSEAFLIVQGHGTMEIDKTFHPVTVGDIIVVEPGEDHHLHSSIEDPIVTLWCHAGPVRHKNQQP